MAHAEGHDRIDTVPGACKAAHRSDCRLHVAEGVGAVPVLPPAELMEGADA